MYHKKASLVRPHVRILLRRRKEYESELNEAASSASGTEAPLRAVVKNGTEYCTQGAQNVLVWLR